ncbi:MAG TPA: VOC family protein [Bacteroidia bacterium]|nr:VOC family protein [Bacteroidia bacterium]
MKPHKIWANLGVQNLQRTTQFYTALGFKSNGNSKELTSFFFGDNEFIIHFFVESRFKNDVNGKIADLNQGSEIVFSLSTTTKEEVDKCAEEVKKAGGTIYAEPQAFEKGYTFGFSDPDGHKFNVLYWPH